LKESFRDPAGTLLCVPLLWVPPMNHPSRMEHPW
jgi:hypothetical protein